MVMMSHDDWKWLSIFGLAALAEIGAVAWLIWRDTRDEYYSGIKRYDEDE
jgi:hypothetical protein